MGFFQSLSFGRQNAAPTPQLDTDMKHDSLPLRPADADSPMDEYLPKQRFSKSGAKSFSCAKGSERQAALDTALLTHASLGAATVEAPPPVTYTSFDQFQNVVEIYKGSISNVYRALCKRTAKRVVVKVYHKEKMTPKQLHKLKREIEIQRRVTDCPYVCQLFATFETPESTHLVLESCEGGDLFKKMIKSSGRMAEQAVCVDVIVPLLRVLESISTLSIIHRDIKPENIFLTADGVVKLGDFGLAIDTSAEIPFCRSGTLDYMAPEVLLNPCTSLEERTATLDDLKIRKIVPYTCKVDVWATGVLAYELLMGRPPFEVENEAETVGRILTCEEIRFDSRFSQEWADFVQQALQKRPRKRPIASRLLEHPWVVKNLAEAYYASGVARSRKAEMEKLLEPIPIYRVPAKHAHAQSRVRFNGASMELEHSGSGNAAADPMSTTARLQAAADPLHHLRTDAPEAGGLSTNLASLSFSRPAENYSTVGVQQLSAEEKGETGAAVGMKARLQLYMSRQRTTER